MYERSRKLVIAAYQDFGQIMACILKLPGISKGILVFTTIESNRIYSPKAHRELLKTLKENWILGLHYNGPQDTHPRIFDFAMTGSNFVENLNGRSLISIDAGKMAPPCFKPSQREKHWDILYVGRCTRRKNVEFFMKIIKQVFNEGHTVRVLLVTTVPKKRRNRVPVNPQKMYMDLFTKAERNRFTFLPLYHDLPFPFDRETLAEFYKCSRVYVHPSAVEQGRLRNAGYAWASGVPVVGLNLYNPDLEQHGLKSPPYYYEAETYGDLPDRIIEAVETQQKEAPDLDPVRRVFSLSHTKDELKSQLEALYQELEEPFVDEGFLLENLDIRIARHHGMDSPSKNSFACNFADFLRQMQEPATIERVVESADPEEDVASAFFGRTFREPPEATQPVALPVPASERRTKRDRLVEQLKRVNLYPLAKKVYNKLYR